MNEQQIFISEQLELQVDSLNELKFKNIFSNDEIAKIVQKRTDYLYLLASSLPKEDLLHPYLSHMLFELNLLTLIKARLKLSKKKNNEFNIHLQFPYNQFKIGISKFSTQVYLFKSYIDFCVQYQLKPNAAFDQVLSKHSNQEHLWLLYAKFEFEYNQAIDNSMEVLKKGIKAIPHSGVFLYMELMKLKLIKEEYDDFSTIFNTMLESIQEIHYEHFFSILKLLLFYWRESCKKKKQDILEMDENEEEETTTSSSGESNVFFPNMIQHILSNVLLKNYRTNEKCLYLIMKFKLEYLTPQHHNSSTTTMSTNSPLPNYETILSVMDHICDRVCHTTLMYHYYILLLSDLFSMSGGDISFINRIHQVFNKMNQCSLLTFRTLFIYSNILLSYQREAHTSVVIRMLKQSHVMLEKLRSVDSHDFVKCLTLLLELTNYSKDSIEYACKWVNGPKSIENESKIEFYKNLLPHLDHPSSTQTFSQEYIYQMHVDAIKNTLNSVQMKKLFFKRFASGDDIFTSEGFQQLDRVVKLIGSLPPNDHQVYQMMLNHLTKKINELEQQHQEGPYYSRVQQLLNHLFEQQMVENKNDWKVYIQYMQYLKKQQRLKTISSVYQKAMNALSGKTQELNSFIQHYDKYIK
ncbi:hypothetical protein FDP41_004149 [Naegleria fowleri]|uniref:U3 small nucleolar RNA-associated protein 6 N-terminal domain-containing protein n=1 Tax=Naegleria fowleri TaxID=5763 RepID=A0A6A5BRP8_NAEFO|nr:uncharacterized protein FDP41_004149 [Naegleria fowleri]KAF0976854.1 hypothetical protein FDP41_004149 [Naegleria fowleri]